MRFTLFYHSLVSDWNHGNAHFLRGIATELLARGHEVRIYEPANGWSRRNLEAQEGGPAVRGFEQAYPRLSSVAYDEHTLDLERAIDGADVVLVHEWSTHELVRRVGEVKRRLRSFRLFFHDTHHRAISDAAAMAAYDLSEYDGVLAFGEALRDVYEQRALAARVWTWHEAADVRVFRPLPRREHWDLVWVGNWGDDERTAELRQYLLEPARSLGLSSVIYGVRYPASARHELARARFTYGGWIANHRVPALFAKSRVTVHVPRRPYVRALPGVPTIRVFEALACGIPLVCAPWSDREGLFSPGRDFLMARSGAEMRRQLESVLRDRALAEALAENGLSTIRARHTCAHRVDELLSILASLDSRRVAASGLP